MLILERRSRMTEAVSDLIQALQVKQEKDPIYLDVLLTCCTEPVLIEEHYQKF